MESRPLLLGHRGVRRNKTISENTLAAFDYSLAQGCDGFEFDVRLSADGQAVICHDPIAKHRNRKSGESSGAVSSTGESSIAALPLLHDVLQRYRESGFLDIELKVPGLETITLDLLRKLPPTRGFVVSSFLPELLIEIYRLHPEVPVGLICETTSQLAQWPDLPVEYVIPHYKLVSQDLISQIKAAGKKIIVWTVNLPADMKRLAEWGVDGLVADDPKRLAHIFI